MKYRRVGKTGLKVSEISIGGWLTFGGTVDAKKTSRIVHAAVDAGVVFIDISDIYARGESEKAIGQAIKDMRRQDLVISSKVFWPMTENPNDRGLSRKHIRESIEGSLRRIGTDYLDIYFCHRADPETEIEETVRVMDDLVREGKVHYWGTSVWDEAQIESAVQHADHYLAYRPAVEQPRYNMFDRHIETEILPVCQKYGIGLTVWSPLAQGLLSGKYNFGIPQGSRGATTEWLKRDLTPDNLERVRKLADLASQLGVTMSQLALAWTLRLPEVSCVLTGATDEAQLLENVKASEIVLEAEALGTVEGILGNYPTAAKA